MSKHRQPSADTLRTGVACKIATMARDASIETPSLSRSSKSQLVAQLDKQQSSLKEGISVLMDGTLLSWSKAPRWTATKAFCLSWSTFTSVREKKKCDSGPEGMSTWRIDPDLSAAPEEKRTAFNDIKQFLYEKNTWFNLLHPTSAWIWQAAIHPFFTWRSTRVLQSLSCYDQMD